MIAIVLAVGSGCLIVGLFGRLTQPDDRADSAAAVAPATPTTAAAEAVSVSPSATPLGTPAETLQPPRPSSTRTPASPMPSTDPRYGTCRAVKVHGYGPYYRGIDPEYEWYVDDDKDGVACE